MRSDSKYRHEVLLFVKSTTYIICNTNFLIYYYVIHNYILIIDQQDLYWTQLPNTDFLMRLQLNTDLSIKWYLQNIYGKDCNSLLKNILRSRLTTSLSEIHQTNIWILHKNPNEIVKKENNCRIWDLLWDYIWMSSVQINYDLK